MDSDTAMHLLSETLLTAAKVSAPILLATLVVGVLISVLQVVTQIQEMTLTFIPKLMVVVLMFLMTGAWMIAVVVEFTKHLFGLVSGM
jgi:flagellar biosynthetic protein FliQ